MRHTQMPKGTLCLAGMQEAHVKAVTVWDEGDLTYIKWISQKLGTGDESASPCSIC